MKWSKWKFEDKRMKTIKKYTYVADDGKIFSNKEECKKYEFELNLEKIKNVQFFDANGNLITDNINQAYLNFVKVVIPTKEDFIALRDVLKKSKLNPNIIKSEGTWYDLNNVLDESEVFRLYSEQETKDIVEQLEYFLKMK